MTDLELAHLHRRVSQLKEEARKNEEAWKRAQARAMELLEADDLKTLLVRATDGLRTGYRLEAATLLIADEEREIRHLLMSEGARPEAFPAVVFVESAMPYLPFSTTSPRPWLGTYIEEKHAPLFPGVENLESIALLPLVRRDRLFGSINLGSADPYRFTRRHAADFLHHLGVIAAFALENAANRARLVQSGLTDALTGWSNRRYLEARLHEEIARCRRERAPLACLMIDVDHFKAVNDRYGHLVGDDVLRGVARRIGNEVRGSDVAARYGGEEFVILLPATEAQAGGVLAERIRAVVADRPFELGGGREPLRVTVSIGVAHLDPEAAGAADAGARLIASADAALYEAKAAGRNRVVLATGG